jgi:hypothetical protein
MRAVNPGDRSGALLAAERRMQIMQFFIGK